MNDPLAPLLFLMRLIHGALCMGVVAFLVVVLAMGRVGPPPETPLVSYVGMGMGLLALLASWVVPGLLEPAWRKKAARLPQEAEQGLRRWCPLYLRRMIIRDALLEGAAFMQVVCYLVEGQPLSPILALVLLVVLVLLFPTYEGVERWAQEQEDLNRQGG